MKQTIFIVTIAVLGLPTIFAQTPPDSSLPGEPPLPPRPPQMTPAPPAGNPQPGATQQTAAPQRLDKPAAQPIPPTPVKKQAPQLPHIALMDFVSLSSAPSRSGRLITEQIRYHLMNSGKCTVADGGETWKALNETGINRIDSATAEQIMAVGQRLQAGYIITGMITDYHEGDLEFSKHKIELVAKLYNSETGKIARMERVKKKSGGEMKELIDRAAKDLAAKLLKRIKH